MTVAATDRRARENEKVEDVSDTRRFVFDGTEYKIHVSGG